MAAVSFAGVDKVYADGTRAVRGLDLAIGDGELMVLVGPSGCGKTTALRLVAGLEAISAGIIRIGERVVNDVECGERDIAMVFQNYALYPHMTVRANMSFPLRLMGMPRAEREARIRKVARMLGLEPHLDRKPARLSGGQRQRVAMGRALVRQPQVFLMDEPLSNLDAKLRVQTRAEIATLQKALGVTTIYVTHDQVEAMTMGDRVAVMRGGVLQQVAEPQALYDWPANLFVAAFVGAPPMNLLHGTVEGEVLSLGAQTLALAPEEARLLKGRADREVVVGVRPERLLAEDGSSTKQRRLRGQVRLRESIGSDVLLTLGLAGVPKVPAGIEALAHDAADRVEADPLVAAASDQAALTGRFSPRLAARPGDRLEVAVPHGALRFFDPETGAALRGAGEGPLDVHRQRELVLAATSEEGIR